MTDDELRAFATDLIQAQASEVDYLGIFEAFEDWGPEHEFGDILDEDDAKTVADLMGSAVITVTFPEVTS